MDKAMERAKEILDLKLDPESPHFARTLTALTSAISSIFNTQAKVDETTLRRRQADKVDELLTLLKAEKAKLEPLEIEASDVVMRPN